MKKVLVLVLILISLGILWAFPLWAIVNFVCWVFHLSFRLSLLQAFTLCLLISVIKSLLSKKEDK